LMMCFCVFRYEIRHGAVFDMPHFSYKHFNLFTVDMYSKIISTFVQVLRFCTHGGCIGL